MCALAKNRVARVTAGLQGNPDRADPASHVVLLDDIDSDAGNHNGGWIDFGPLDRKLYVSVGDGGSVHTKSQDMTSLNGKVLRLNSDGTVPFDNPFVGLFQARPEIYALGFRNSLALPLPSRRPPLLRRRRREQLEEIDWVVAGGNYGWPTTEGTFDPAVYPQFVEPIFAYSHSSVGGSCSITGGDFGSETSFPGDYQQSYFFGDYVVGFIRRVVLAADGVTVQSVTDFASGVGGVTDLIAGPEGALTIPTSSRARCTESRRRAPTRLRSLACTATPQQGRRAAHGAALERGLDRRRRRSADGEVELRGRQSGLDGRGALAHLHRAGRLRRDAHGERQPHAHAGDRHGDAADHGRNAPGRHDHPARGSVALPGRPDGSPCGGTAVDAQDGTLPPRRSSGRCASITTRTTTPSSVGSPARRSSSSRRRAARCRRTSATRSSFAPPIPRG
jgi:hypothetical protein